jgi:hypothetical protein
VILLKEWSVVCSPEGENRLRGFVFGHPKFEDGADVITSEVQSYDPQQGIVKTVYNEYKLDEYTIGEFIL